MTRRRGELDSSGVDRDWPHQVAIQSHLCTGRQFNEHRDFCKNLSLCPRGHSVLDGDVSYRVFCFADADHAAKFKERFDGVPFYPEDRGKGARWMRWNRPDGDVRRPIKISHSALLW